MEYVLEGTVSRGYVCVHILWGLKINFIYGGVIAR